MLCTIYIYIYIYLIMWDTGPYCPIAHVIRCLLLVCLWLTPLGNITRAIWRNSYSARYRKFLLLGNMISMLLLTNYESQLVACRQQRILTMEVEGSYTCISQTVIPSDHVSTKLVPHGPMGRFHHIYVIDVSHRED